MVHQCHLRVETLERHLHSRHYANSVDYVNKTPISLPRQSRAETKARTRALLLDAAVHEFSRRGFAGTSVEDIASAAGFTIGALYSNFAGKEEIFVELLTKQSASTSARAADIVTDQDSTITERQRALGEVLLTVADREVDVAPLQAEFWLYALRHPELLAQLSVQVLANRDTVTAALKHRYELRGSEAPSDVDDLSTVMLALFQGLVNLRRTNPEIVPDDLYGKAAHWLLTGRNSVAEQS